MFLYAGLFFVVIWFLLLTTGVPGILKMTRLTPNYIPLKRDKWPKVSIIVAACNEEDTMKNGIQSLIGLDYPNLEIIVVNDRSTDLTGKIVEAIARKDERVKIINIVKLPERWLGKNFAMYQGAQKATGEWILFTDADIIFHSKVLKVSLNHVLAKELDHLIIAPTFITNSLLIKGMVMMTTFNFFLFYRPQYVNNKKSKSFMGFGAFNLMKRAVYEQIGTYKALRLCVDDDIQLGKKIKKSGFSQDFALGFQLMQVEWYKSFKELMNGLEKNALPPVHYRIFLMIISMIFMFFFYLSPYFGLVFAETPLESFFFIAVILMMMFYIAFLDLFSLRSVFVAFFFPIYLLLFFYVIGMGLFKIWRRKGINWRGTVYSLKMLREKE